MECQAKTPESEHQEKRRVGDALRASLLPWALWGLHDDWSDFLGVAHIY